MLVAQPQNHSRFTHRFCYRPGSPTPERTVAGMRFKYADWIRRDTDGVVAVFGQARLVRRLDGKAALQGGTDQDRVKAKEWIALFWHEAVLEK